MQNQLIDSATSYTISGMAIAIAYVADIATLAGALAVIFGCLAALLRLVYDGVRLYRYLRAK